ncbi:MAG: aminopeptidase P N-terminal domain-containing protein, partial [Deltaproteobacteria bacterium]|nr:aminopeptidase P N-terminal domain-containing protein [Deltaproteobacteria bacterium]
QDSDLYYLTGLDEPESVLVLTNQHEDHRAILFVRPKKREREMWDGPRAGVEGAVEAFGADVAFPIDELSKRLPDYLGNVERLHYRLAQNDEADAKLFDCLNLLRRGGRRGVTAPATIIDSSVHLHEMRLRKSDAELATMGRAAAITKEAHLRAMQIARPGMHEYEIDAELLYMFRKHGSERPAYESIVGSGPNATILHYRAGDRVMKDGELLLIDAGCELGYYASDVTRTFPVNGKFTDEQRAVYEVVLHAQKACIKEVKPGATLEALHEGAVRSITEGLIDIGLLEGDLDALIEDKKYEPFYMHRTSHWLGMDVHDVGHYYVDGKHRPLEPGFVLTVEPGVYIATDAEGVDERWRGIGVRIEDDVLVTKSGHEVLTAGIPKEIDQVEAACA